MSELKSKTVGQTADGSLIRVMHTEHATMNTGCYVRLMVGPVIKVEVEYCLKELVEELELALEKMGLKFTQPNFPKGG